MDLEAVKRETKIFLRRNLSYFTFFAESNLKIQMLNLLMKICNGHIFLKKITSSKFRFRRIRNVVAHWIIYDICRLIL